MAHLGVHYKHSSCLPLGDVAQYKGSVAVPGPSAMRHASLVVPAVTRRFSQRFGVRVPVHTARLSVGSVAAVSGMGWAPALVLGHPALPAPPARPAEEGSKKNSAASAL